jgi:hypothetical protein
MGALVSSQAVRIEPAIAMQPTTFWSIAEVGPLTLTRRPDEDNNNYNNCP